MNSFVTVTELGEVLTALIPWYAGATFVIVILAHWVYDLLTAIFSPDSQGGDE